MSEREWHFYLDDMIGFAENVLAYSSDLDKAAFISSGLNYDATLRSLEMIGEAATHIPGEIREGNSSIAWRLVIATRNKLIHGYLGIDNDILWSIIKDDIPSLLVELKKLKSQV